MRQRLILIAALCAICSLSLRAQDKAVVDKLAAYGSPADTTQGWKYKGVAGITFGQTSLTNWQAGGDNTISGNFVLNATANYRKGCWFWDNNLSGEYGMVYSSSEDWKKSADKLSITSVAGRQFSKHWSGAFLLNFYTQFSKGYDYPNKVNYISTFMAPGYLDGALGFNYKPNDKYSVFLSPLSERATFVLNDSLSTAGKFGVDPGKKVKWETGAYIMASTNQTLVGSLNLISNLNMFTPYNDDFGKFNIDWTILLSYKFNKFLSATLNTTFRYYEREIKKVQVKEIFGLGITYNF